MSFFKFLFRDKNMERDALRRYVDIEFRGADRAIEYKRLLQEAGL